MELDRIRYIKEKISVLEYAQNVLGLPVRKSGDRCASLAPDSHNPTAMVVYDDWWYDFKQGCGGDVIDLCSEARHGGDKGAAIRELGGDTGGWNWVEYTKALNGKIQHFHTQLRKADMDYLYRRGIKKETVERLRIGYDEAENRLTIPYYKNGYVAYYVSRDRSGKPEASKYKKAKLDGLNENIPWGLHTLEPSHRIWSNTICSLSSCGNDMESGEGVSKSCEEIDKTVTQNSQGGVRKSCEEISEDVTLKRGLLEKYLIITEGVFDALSFEQEGFKVLSPMGGYFSKDMLRQVINIAQEQDTVFICFDSDDAGSRFQIDMSKLFFKHHINFVCGTLPTGIKDVSDYYAAGNPLWALIEAAQPGIEVLASRIKDRDEFKTFMYEAGRFVDAPELTALCEHVEQFPKKWLDAVLKQALRCPPEALIVKEMLNAKQLKYIDGLGFYEYTHGVWKRRNDVEIGAYIGDQMGQWRTGSRLRSVLTLARSDTVSNVLFNQQPIFNFRNGVLNLTTRKFSEHSETYMSSMQVDYDYDENADCPRWRQFVSEVTNGDEGRMNLLQEIAGYVLFSDNRLQKCFFLMGDGANGKSVFLDILSAVFGETNVSNVEMSGLVEPFQRIHLLNSILNISTETRSDVKGAESVFKQIVVGDTINGCYKNKDFITFRPRTKFITACNEYIKAKDTTSGFLRRICFVSFPRKFEGASADKDLTRKLKAELSGIFNWAYAGYDVLRENKEFTVTADQKTMMEEFTKTINPLVAFIEENREGILTGALTRKRVYEIYASWCKEAGHEVKSRTKFIHDIRQTARQVGLPLGDKKVLGVRYLVFPDGDIGNA